MFCSVILDWGPAKDGLTEVLQATNLRSFQLLQEYLNAAKGGNTSHRFIYHFEFFIRRAENNDGDANNDNVLERVEVSLPPPQVKFHPQRGTEMLPGTKSAIGKLFAACGLSAEVTGGLAGDEPVSLSDFFQQASERQRQNEASVLNLEQQVMLTAALGKLLSQFSERLDLLFLSS